MNSWQKLRRTFRALFRKSQLDADMVEEMRAHIELRTQENIEAGLNPEEARNAALRQFGRTESIQETCRDQRGVTWLENLVHDVRYGARQLRRNPGFTAAAVLTLALGIGANTAIFTVANALLFRSLPVREPEELVQAVVADDSGRPEYTFSFPLYEQLRDGAHGLSGLFAAGGIGLKDTLVVPSLGNTETEYVRGQPVSGNFFSVLRVPPLIGRTITSEDDRPQQPQAVAVISHSYWQRRFGADPSVIGKPVTFKGLPFNIVGVTPPGFFGFQPGENPDLWWPIQMAPQVDRDPNGWRLKEGSSWLRLMGRLAPEIGRGQAGAELKVAYQHYRNELVGAHASDWPSEQQQRALASELELRPGHAGWTRLRDRSSVALSILTAVVAMVLVIGCTNVASLLLVRSASRAREFSVRNALGAGRARLVRQLLTESVLLAVSGGLCGLLLAQLGTRALLALMSLDADPISFSIAPDARVLVFTTGIALATGMLFGLGPALRASRMDVASVLRGAVVSRAGNASRQRLQQSLVVAQVALSLMLLVGAGLFVRTLRNLKHLDLGFNRANVVQFDLDFGPGVGAKQRAALYREVLTGLEALPEVQSASLYGFGLLSGNGWHERVVADGQDPAPGEELDCQATLVGQKFLETLGFRMLSGRDFTPQDEWAASFTNAPWPAVINQAMARRYFGDADPVGRRLHFPGRPDQKFEIIALVKDAKYDSLRQDSPPTFYVPSPLNPYQPMTLVVRTRATPAALTLPRVQQAMRQVFAPARVEGFRTLEAVVDESVRQERVVAETGSFFSLLSLALACLGLYGVLSFAVVQRTREIGVRVALGAQRSDVLSLIVAKGLKLALIGAVIGIAGGLALTRLVSTLLYGVTPTDPVTFAGVLGLLLVIAFFASWLPARRAAHVDPMEALRAE